MQSMNNTKSKEKYNAFQRDRRFEGWLYKGKVLAPYVSIVSYKNVLKYLFLVKIGLLAK